MSANDLIAAVNQLRVANNLPPYRTDPILMSIAQAHSDYQASTGRITHTGAGGTRPKDRAIAAGYGGGSAIFVSENIAGGTSLGVQGAVQLWQADSIHLNTLLGANYQDVGAGVAKANDMTYFTLDVGYVAGSPGSGNPGSGNQASTMEPGWAVTSFPDTTLDVSTPAADGSITHIVQAGQTIWGIAVMYGTEVESLIALNNLPSDAWIYPGDELVIRAPFDTPTATMAETQITPRATATLRPRRTVTQQTFAFSISTTTPQRVSATEIPVSAVGGIYRLPVSPLLIIAAIVGVGLGLAILGIVLKRNE